MHESELLSFIKSHEDWKDLLAGPPYNLIIRQESYLALFKYRINSDQNLKLVRESRGHIIDLARLEIACRPFDKFFNFQETFAAQIDWSSAVIEEKIDGSIIKVWWDKTGRKWRVSTNGAIDAYEARLLDPVSEEKGAVFGVLFDEAVKNLGFDLYSRLDPENTYIFELVSPDSRVIISYPETRIIHLGTRRNETGREEEIDLGVAKPRRFPFSCLDEIIEKAMSLPWTEEGFVVRDAGYNRIKVKSLAYVDFHHKMDQLVTQKASFVLRIILDDALGGLDDFLSFFPRHKGFCDEILNRYKAYLEEITKTISGFRNIRELPRKEAAAIILKYPYSTVLFKWLDGRFELANLPEFLKTLRFAHLEEQILKDMKPRPGETMAEWE
ncbi:MAG: hypothetical protein LBC90_03830 [Candidatus Adiutrix sp.]|jgi:hypothetical protein|nr:hypothetical protein [Candidatus Adiutrix sp.]